MSCDTQCRVGEAISNAADSEANQISCPRLASTDSPTVPIVSLKLITMTANDTSTARDAIAQNLPDDSATDAERLRNHGCRLVIPVPRRVT